MSDKKLPESVETNTFEDVKNYLEREIKKANENFEFERALVLHEMLEDHLSE